MKMSGEELIPAPRDRVWEALNDPDVLKQCIPGCEDITKKSPTEFEARVVAKVGPVKAGFTGAVKLTDLDPPNSYTISGEGKGGAAGFAKGGAKVNLREEGTSTRLAYDVDAQVGGKLAQIGSRLIDSTARKMADQFFGRFAEIASGGAPIESAAEAEGLAAPEEEDAKPAVKKARVPRKAAVKPAAKSPRPRKTARGQQNGSAAVDDVDTAAVATPSLLPEAAIVAPPRPEAAENDRRQAPVAGSGGGNLIWWLAVIVLIAALIWSFTG